MGEAFERIDAFCWDFAADPGASPDAAQDYIFMMHVDDWQALEDTWSDRPARWHEACVYVLGYGPPDKCLPFLQRAMFGEEAAVAKEAAIGYSCQVLEHHLSGSVPALVKERLEQLLEASGSTHMEEVVELLRVLKAAPGSG